MLRAALFILITFINFEKLELAKMSKIRQWLNYGTFIQRNTLQLLKVMWLKDIEKNVENRYR